MGDYIGDYYRVIKGDTRSLDYNSCGKLVRAGQKSQSDSSATSRRGSTK